MPLIHFLISVASTFSKYLLIFLKDEPLIKILHRECVSLLQQLMGRFWKADVFSGKSGNEYPQIQLDCQNQVEDINLEIGDNTLTRRTFKVWTSYLFLKLPLTNIIIRCCKVVQPSLQKEALAFTLKGIWILGKRLLVSVDIYILSDEWTLYQVGDI